MPFDTQSLKIFIKFSLSLFFFVCLCLWYHIQESESVVAWSCPTLCNPVDCRPPGFSVYGISQARILEWVSISFSRGSSRPRDRTWVSRIVDRRFTAWATREVQWFTNINESPGKFVNVQNAGPHPQRFLILETCPWICMSNKFPRDSDAAVLGITV